MNNKKAIVAMSGGVDSSVAAYLTKQAGYEAVGVTLKLFDEQGRVCTDKSCCSLEDVEDARAVCRRLDIPYYVYNFKENFSAAVIDKFIATYESGGTPNPCIDCNRYIKFEKLLHRARELESDCVVTGHYSTVEYDQNAKRYFLKKAVDLTKDQSYVLYMLSQEQLSKISFPLGTLAKTQVRELAQSLDFVNAKKHDSQDICFVPDGDYAGFIERYTNKTYPPGDFVDTSGNVLGSHKGIIRYTIGQRRGLGLAVPQSVYVCGKDIAQNKVICCTQEQLYRSEVLCNDINLIMYDKLDAPMRVKAKIRYNQPEQPATVYQTDDDTLRLVFDKPQRAVAPGQAAVIYLDDYVLGGGTIV